MEKLRINETLSFRQWKCRIGIVEGVADQEISESQNISTLLAGRLIYFRDWF